MKSIPQIVSEVLVTFAALGVGGCGRSIRAVDCPEQIVLHGCKAALQQTDLVEATVRPVKVPWASDQGPTAFRIDLTNRSNTAIAFELDRVELRDSFGRVLRPIPPQRLFQAFGHERADSATPAVTAAFQRHAYRGLRTYPIPRRHYFARHRWYGPRPWYGHYYRGYPYGYCWYDDGFYSGLWIGSGGYYPDGYYDEQRIAVFLSELLESAVLVPQEKVGGNVVFAYAPEHDDELTLSIPIRPASRGTTSAPADQNALNPTDLEFRFEVD
jgi:hypothetical protein